MTGFCFNVETEHGFGKDASSNKCHASSDRCPTSSNNKLGFGCFMHGVEFVLEPFTSCTIRTRF